MRGKSWCKTSLLSTHSTDDQNWKKDVWCHFKALLVQWNDKSTRNSAYFQETVGRLVNCCGDNESLSMIESIFHNVTAFCLSKSTLFTPPREVFTGFNGPTYSLCNYPSVLVRFYLAGVSRTQQLIPAQFHSGLDKKSGDYSEEKLGYCHLLQHVVYSVMYSQSFVWILQPPSDQVL